jgi:O-methyltransferase
MIYRMVALVRKYFARLMPVGSQRFGRTRIADLAVRYVKDLGLQGAYLEFGVYRGSTFSTFYHLFKKHGVQHSMWAFDSFEGLPAMREGDSGNWYKGQYSCDLRSFVKFMKMWGVPERAFNVVPGFFDESLTENIPVEQAAIIWIDCDLYSSTVPVLKFIKPLLQDGTLVLFDDFGGTADEGERLALKEFLADNPELTFSPYRTFHTKGQSYLVAMK